MFSSVGVSSDSDPNFDIFKQRIEILHVVLEICTASALYRMESLMELTT